MSSTVTRRIPTGATRGRKPTKEALAVMAFIDDESLSMPELAAIAGCSPKSLYRMRRLMELRRRVAAMRLAELPEGFVTAKDDHKTSTVEALCCDPEVEE